MKPRLYDVFLCHNRQDKALVSDLERKLTARGLRCWLDRHELKPGTLWRRFVEDEWPRIGALAVCLGPNGLSDGQKYEMDRLISTAEATQHIVPVLLPNLPATIDPREWVHESLRDRIWVDLRAADSDPIESLAWGIGGENPHIRMSLGNYYRKTDGLEDEELLSCLGSITRAGVEVLNYPREVRKVMMAAFEDPNCSDHVIRFHDGASVAKSSPVIQSQGGSAWNLDHIWPKAFGFLEDWRVNADLHNIAIADRAYNARRGAGFFYDRRLDFVERETEISPSRQFDPRGVIARACFYMVARYQGLEGDPVLVLDEQPNIRGENHLGSLETLLFWNKLADVTPAERNRNDIFAEAQGNRNPFVDRPGFADLIWYPV